MFESLDYIYLPAPEFEQGLGYYKELLGGELLWNIAAFGTRVAAVRLAATGPLILLAGHRKQGGPLLVYRVKAIKKTSKELSSRGWSAQEKLEIPNGPCQVFADPAGNALAIYENVRPNAAKSFEGRFD